MTKSFTSMSRPSRSSRLIRANTSRTAGPGHGFLLRGSAPAFAFAPASGGAL
jgi:hypothetical protein